MILCKEYANADGSSSDEADIEESDDWKGVCYRDLPCASRGCTVRVRHGQSYRVSACLGECVSGAGSCGYCSIAEAPGVRVWSSSSRCRGLKRNCCTVSRVSWQEGEAC